MDVLARGNSGQFEGGITVYLRILDPPDGAAYMNLPPTPLAGPRDNCGALAPTVPCNSGPTATLEGNGITPTPNTIGVWQGVSGSNGEVDFFLALPSNAAAGDNYQIEAAYDPTFPAGQTVKSGTVTAWKRIFVEKRRMLKNGMRLVTNAMQGATEIHVFDNHYGGNMGTRRTIAGGDHIVLVHSPSIDRSNALDGWYLEYHNVLDVTQVTTSDYRVRLGTKQGKNIITEQIQRPSYKFEPADLAVGDAIAYVPGGTLSATDYFDGLDDLLAQYDASGNAISAFPQSFVEYYVLPDGYVFGSVPVPHILTSASPTLQRLANRWSASVDSTGTATPNHQLLVIGDADATYDNRTPPDTAGQRTLGIPGQLASFSYRGAIDWLVQNDATFRGMNAANWSAKNEAHELAHQWYVDENPAWSSTDPYHCPTDSLTFDSTPAAPLYCLEAAAGTGVSSQKDNMIARFHLILRGGVWDSEYFTIRQRPDPFVP